ncbi:PKD-like domain-containing protein [Chitinophaga sp. Cy-1792]|uniref:PKD-like domain-containing protein n=1 Tax=Chitinophaga sp. Cy-1792 TaxID=2608339 RepID=UPI0014246113|nr:PKD-like domain-containing protein [Chitinophaga sp. Cy-1792]NIG55715.1 hypothetical protein [Chitinophaga sp. Cy-1792]
MKRTLLLNTLAAVIFFVTACTKEQYNTPAISGVGTDTIVLNIGDKFVLAPNITNVKGNDYAWLVNGKQMASGQVNYTFEATASGNFDITFKANNKGGTDQQTFKIFVEKVISLSIDKQLAVPMGKVLDISPTVTGPDRSDYTYEWSINDSVIGKQRNLSFISATAGSFELKLRATAGKQTATTTRTIAVAAAQYNQNAYTVLEYAPSPAKNFNWSIIGTASNWKFGDEYQLGYNAFLAKASDMRKANTAPGLVLGSWGGYAIFQFDHTVANAHGIPDLEVTATYSKLDLPAVYVAYDRNKNGKPDEDEWYEIKNADFGLEDMPDYQMTFTYDSTTTDAKRIYSYLSWKDNQATPVGGQIITNKTFSSSVNADGNISTRGFFPGLAVTDFSTKATAMLDGWKTSFIRKGKRITRNVTGGNPFQQTLNIDIDLAVDKNGESVQLPGIDFVKVQRVIYPFEQDYINAGGAMVDSNMDEGRMLQVGSILDKHLKN